MAIADINKRFWLFQDFITIENDGIEHMYNMPEDYMQLLAVIDPIGLRVAINKEDDKNSIFTPSPYQVIIPHYWEKTKLTFIYLKQHQWITVLKSGSEENGFTYTYTPENLPIGSQFLKAIMHYVAYLAFETINDTPQYGHHNHLNDYEQELLNLKALGFEPNEALINATFWTKGFR